MAIGVALIGSGIFIKEEHLPAVLATSDFELKAIYSRSLKSAQALEQKVDLYSDDAGAGKTYHDLLLRQDIQAVIIALPILNQPEHIEAALAAGKHVLSEKPVSADVKRAEHLINHSKNLAKNGATWAVAENFRFIDSLVYGRQSIEKLGRILGFRIKLAVSVALGTKYIETSWRKKPEYQGGFLLDGGVHFVAAARYLLGETNKPKSLSAYTALLQPHLPPVDTVNSIWQTTSGISGTFSVSFGTPSGDGTEYTINCEKGSITIVGHKVTVVEGVYPDSKSSEKEFPNEENGVKQEVKAWGKSLVEGKPNKFQSPEQALADLEILELMLRSGEADGAVQTLQYQV